MIPRHGLANQADKGPDRPGLGGKRCNEAYENLVRRGGLPGVEAARTPVVVTHAGVPQRVVGGTLQNREHPVRWRVPRQPPTWYVFQPLGEIRRLSVSGPRQIEPMIVFKIARHL